MIRIADESVQAPTSSASRFAVPPRLDEVTVVATHLRTQGL